MLPKLFSPFPCCTRPAAPPVVVGLVADDNEDDDEDESLEEDKSVSERLEEIQGEVNGGVGTSPELFTQIVVSSLATLGPTVITVGRTSVNANVEPGKGSRYGGGLRDFIDEGIGKSKRRRGELLGKLWILRI